jgi:hypothetical protein
MGTMLLIVSVLVQLQFSAKKKHIEFRLKLVSNVTISPEINLYFRFRLAGATKGGSTNLNPFQY